MTLQHIDQLFHDNPYRLDKCLHKSARWILDEIEDLQREYGEQVSSVGEILYARQWSGSDGITNISFKTTLADNHVAGEVCDMEV